MWGFRWLVSFRIANNLPGMRPPAPPLALLRLSITWGALLDPLIDVHMEAVPPFPASCARQYWLISSKPVSGSQSLRYFVLRDFLSRLSITPQCKLGSELCAGSSASTGERDAICLCAAPLFFWLDDSQCIVGSQAVRQLLFAAGGPVNIHLIHLRGVPQAKV